MSRRITGSLVILAMLPTLAAMADSIRLRDEAGVRSASITLGDIAELDGSWAVALKDVVVGAFGEGADKLVIALPTIRETLNREHVNWGVLSLEGFASCTVHRLDAEPKASKLREPAQNVPTVAAANPDQPVDLEKPMTLGAALLQAICDRTGQSRADLRVIPASSDASLLATGLIGRRFEIRPITSARFGLVPFNLREIDTDGRTLSTQQIQVQVQRRAMGLVTTRPVTRQARFSPDDIELRELWLDHDGPAPLADRNVVLDLTAATSLRSGTPLYAEAVAQPLLVRRGDLVSVRALVGDLVVTVMARARQDGSMNELITLQSLDSRETFAAMVTGRREATLRPAPQTQADGAAAPAAPTAEPDALSLTVSRLQQEGR